MYGDAEIAVSLIGTVHANPQLSSVSSTCCECKYGEYLQNKKKQKQVNAPWGVVRHCELTCELAIATG